MKIKIIRFVLILVIAAVLTGFVLTGLLFFPLLQLFFESYSQELRLQTIPCSELPSWGQVNQTLVNHNETVRRIEEIAGGWVGVYPVERCDDKASIAIYHGTEPAKHKIKQIIGDSFYGVPVVYYNV